MRSTTTRKTKRRKFSLSNPPDTFTVGPREVAELWVCEDCACGEASVLLGTLYGWARRFPMLHLREREEDLLRTHELIVRFEGIAGEKGVARS